MVKVFLWAMLVAAVLVAEDKKTDEDSADDLKSTSLGKPADEGKSKGGFARWFRWGFFKRRGTSPAKNIHTIILPEALSKDVPESQVEALKSAANRAILACFHLHRPSTFSLIYSASSKVGDKTTKWEFMFATKLRKNKVRYIFGNTLERTNGKSDVTRALPLKMAFSESAMDILRFAGLEYNSAKEEVTDPERDPDDKEAEAATALEKAQTALLNKNSTSASSATGKKSSGDWKMTGTDGEEAEGGADRPMGMRGGRGQRMERLKLLMKSGDKSSSASEKTKGGKKSGDKEEKKKSSDEDAEEKKSDAEDSD